MHTLRTAIDRPRAARQCFNLPFAVHACTLARAWRTYDWSFPLERVREFDQRNRHFRGNVPRNRRVIATVLLVATKSISLEPIRSADDCRAVSLSCFQKIKNKKKKRRDGKFETGRSRDENKFTTNNATLLARSFHECIAIEGLMSHFSLSLSLARCFNCTSHSDCRKFVARLMGVSICRCVYRELRNGRRVRHDYRYQVHRALCASTYN